MADWDAERKKATLERMLTIRRFEETVVGLFEAHEFMTHFHLYIGQEATGVPLMDALGPDDKIATHHRNHGHVLARGTDPKIALAEILGRENGMNRGAGGTMHLSDTERGFLVHLGDRRGQHQPLDRSRVRAQEPGRRRGGGRAVRRRRARGGRGVRVAQLRRAAGRSPSCSSARTTARERSAPRAAASPRRCPPSRT